MKPRQVPIGTVAGLRGEKRSAKTRWLVHIGASMSLDLIPPEHLKFLLKKLAAPRIPEAQLSTLMAYASGDLSAREHVLKRLDQYSPGTSNYLSYIWCFRGKKAVQIWELPFLRGYSARQALDLQHRRMQLTSTTWHDIAGGALGQDRLTHVFATDGEILGRVRLIRNTSSQYEGERKVLPHSYDVDLRVSFAATFRIAEVYATYEDARDALLIFLRWLTGAEVPRNKSLAQQKFIIPLTFNEHQIKALAARIGLKSASLRGREPRGKVGAIQMWGHMDGEHLEQLDPSVDIVERQEQTENAERWYNLVFRHHDGYDEKTRLEFVFSKTQPRIVFGTKASRSAIDYLITQFCAELGRG
jgi:hypothetical protein